MSALAVVTRPADGETDERDLVAAVRSGDDRAFELLFQRYQPQIASYVRGMVRDHGRAEDITQEVFLAALRRLRAQTEREIRFKPWIYEIAKNKCIDKFRRTRGVSEVSFDARDAIGADEYGRLAQPGVTPDSAVEDKVAIDNLCGAFGGLSRVHHDILVLREFEGLSYREIGERLGMSRPAVESTLFRARRRLTEEYEELVSGERCLRVQGTVDASGGRSAGLRDQRRMARHLAHCQPCRRYAGRAGMDLGTISRPAAAAARVAGLLPLPAFLRRRLTGDEAAPLLGHGGSFGQWSANAAATLDPGLLSSWTKAVATAATVAVPGWARAPRGASAPRASARTPHRRPSRRRSVPSCSNPIRPMRGHSAQRRRRPLRSGRRRRAKRPGHGPASSLQRPQARRTPRGPTRRRQPRRHRNRAARPARPGAAGTSADVVVAGAPPATGVVGSVSSTVTDGPASTTAVLSDLGR